MPYMSPEQFMDLALSDARADIYALGKMLYEAVNGKIRKETSFALKAAHLPKANTSFLKALDKIIRLATDEDRNKRIPTIRVFKESLEPANRSPRPPWPSWWTRGWAD
jgi:serine/threonine-protein kinase